MSVPSSTILPRSDPTSGDTDELQDFDGAADILRAWCSGMRPDPDLTVSQWADRHRMLSGRASAEPGRYRTARTPYMGEIMDRLRPGDRDPADRVHEGRAGGRAARARHRRSHALRLDHHGRDRRGRSALRRARAHLPGHRSVAGVSGSSLLRSGVRRRRAGRRGRRASLAGLGLHERPARRADADHGGYGRARDHRCRRASGGAMPSTAATRSTCRTRT